MKIENSLPPGERGGGGGTHYVAFCLGIRINVIMLPKKTSMLKKPYFMLTLLETMITNNNMPYK